MKQFMDEHFLLQTKTAQKLYHEYAKDQKIYDYHCHLNPKEIAENKKFSTITDAWLGATTTSGAPCVQMEFQRN